MVSGLILILIEGRPTRILVCRPVVHVVHGRGVVAVAGRMRARDSSLEKPFEVKRGTKGGTQGGWVGQTRARWRERNTIARATGSVGLGPAITKCRVSTRRGHRALSAITWHTRSRRLGPHAVSSILSTPSVTQSKGDRKGGQTSHDPDRNDRGPNVGMPTPRHMTRSTVPLPPSPNGSARGTDRPRGRGPRPAPVP